MRRTLPRLGNPNPGKSAGGRPREGPAARPVKMSFHSLFSLSPWSFVCVETGGREREGFTHREHGQTSQMERQKPSCSSDPSQYWEINDQDFPTNVVDVPRKKDTKIKVQKAWIDSEVVVPFFFSLRLRPSLRLANEI